MMIHGVKMPSLTESYETNHHGHQTLRSMEGLRGLAVFLVFVVHYMTLIEPWIEKSLLLSDYASMIRSLGNVGVDLFFVLSGYLIYGMLVDKPRKYFPFLRRRIERIYPTFTVVFLIYVALSAVFPEHSKLRVEPWDVIIYLGENFLLLPGIFDIEPMITIAWSLSYEAFFYLTIPIAVQAFLLRRWNPRCRIVLFLALIVTVWLFPSLYGGHVRFIMFGSGILLYEFFLSIADLSCSSQWSKRRNLLVCIPRFLCRGVYWVDSLVPERGKTILAPTGCGRSGFLRASPSSLISMKILHVLDHSLPLHSGYTFRTLAILRQQKAFGWDTVQLTSSKHSAPSLAMDELDGFRFYRTEAGKGAVSRLPVVNQWDVVRSLEQRMPEVIEEESPDLIHAHSPSLNGLAAVRVGRRMGLPVVYECRAFWEDAAADHGTAKEWGPRYRLTRMTETRVFRQVDAVTCICEGLRTDIVARGIPERKVTVIPNAVDTVRFGYGPPRDAALAAELGLEGATVLGFLGSFYAYEGLTLAICAMPKILRSYPGARLMLVGGGPQEDELKALTHAQGVAHEVLFVGRVPHDEVARFYSLVDVLLYPRLPMRLTELVTPLKPLEAMAQGKLVLASDVGGHRELIRHGENGRLFAAGDVDALARTVVDFLAEPDAWDPQREAGYRFVERERNWPVSVARYRQVYRSLPGLSAGDEALCVSADQT